MSDRRRPKFRIAWPTEFGCNADSTFVRPSARVARTVVLALIAFWWSLIVQPPTASAWWQQRRNFQLQPRNFLAPPINENLRGRRLRGEYDGQQPVYSSSRKFTQDWQNAQVLLKSEKPVEALTLLQGILNADEDSYLLNDQGVPDSRNLSLKGATRELLQNLSGDLRQQYEFQWGAEADRHWQQYLKTGQKESLEILIRRFPVSLSGRKGAERLAALNFDRHQPIAAARIYQDLLKSSPQPGEDRRMLTVRLAASWYLAGDDEQAQDVLIEAGLAKNAGQIVIAGRRVNLPVDAQKIIPWLEEHFGSRTLDEDRAFVTSTPEKDLVPGRSGPENWALRGGLPTRNGSGPLGSPHWEPVWQAPTLFRQSTDASERQNDVNATWKKMRDKQRRDRGLSIPAAQPLVVGETVLYRSLTHLSAVDLATGQLKWESFVIDPAANVLMNQYANLEMQATTARESPFEAYLRYRAWFLATTSTLSSDGNLVYVLDDIGHIRTSSMDRRTQIPPLMPRGFNRLLAFDANSGKLRWEAGDDRGDYELELAGAYFLGPPLPLDGMLYCLMKDGDELILLVLNAQTGEREWELSLLAAPAVPQIRKLSVDGLSPSYSQGVLICPSDTGVLTAVDIVHRELVWSFVDPLLSQTDEAMARMAMQRQHGQEVFMGMPSSLIYGLADRTWLDGLPVIAGGNLLVTLPESHDLYCLSLIDGKLKWNVPRDRGLFIGTASGGQVLVVEEHQLQSYRLSDGAPVWPQPIQLPAAPCGRGLRSGNIYQLPIEKQEILHIDLQSGQILSRAAVPPDVELGNLIGAHGAVVSQASNSVTAFQRLDVTWGRLNETLAKQPDDAEALAIRGEIRLSLGAEEAGLNDLRKSFELSNNNRARIRLIHSLMEGLRFDFPRYRKYRDEVDKLMIDPALRWEYLKLFAEGLDQSGEKSAAYFEYLKLFDIADAVKFDELNDETLSTLPQAWIPTRLDEIYRSASAADRKSFDEEIERRWGSVEKLTDAKILFRFAHEFAGHPLSWIARKRGIDLAKSSRSAIQRELELSALAEAPQPTISGYAIAEWTRLLMDRNRFVDAQTLLKRLEAEYADIECHPGQSGRQLATAWKEEIAKNASDEVTGQWPTGRIRIERRERVQTELTPQYYPIPFDESPSPFFEGWVMEMDQQRANIRARDQFGRLRWTLPLLETSFVVPDVRGNSVKAWGHLLVFSLTNGFLVVDTLNSESRPKVLWQKPLIEHSRNPRIDQGIQSADHIGAGGQRRQRLFDSQGKPIGRVGPVNHSSLIYQVGRQIFAADIFTGETLWTRRDVFPGSRLFGNHDVAVAVSLDNSQTLVLNARSGALINQLIIPSDYYQLQLHGQHALIWEHEALPQSLYLLDLVTGQNVWEHQFRDAVQVAMIETDEIAVIDERGELTIYRIDDGTIRLTHPLPLKNELHEFLVLRNDEQYLLLTNVEPREKKLQRTFAVSQASDMINGPVFSFSRESGALQWSSHIEFQQFDLNQTRHLPILVFFCKRYELSPQGLSIVRPQFAVLILDRRNGKICFEEEWAEVIGDVKVVPQMTPQVDRQRIVVDLNRSIIELQFTDEAETEPPATDAKEPDAKSPDAQKSESP